MVEHKACSTEVVVATSTACQIAPCIRTQCTQCNLLPSACNSLQYHVEVASRSGGDWDAIPRFIGAAAGTSKDAFYT